MTHIGFGEPTTAAANLVPKLTSLAMENRDRYGVARGVLNSIQLTLSQRAQDPKPPATTNLLTQTEAQQLLDRIPDKLKLRPKQ